MVNISEEISDVGVASTLEHNQKPWSIWVCLLIRGAFDIAGQELQPVIPTIFSQPIVPSLCKLLNTKI
jgi:hypothetical protein